MISFLELDLSWGKNNSINIKILLCSIYFVLVCLISWDLSWVVICNFLSDTLQHWQGSSNCYWLLCKSILPRTLCWCFGKRSHELHPFTVRNPMVHTSCQQEVDFGEKFYFWSWKATFDPEMDERCFSALSYLICPRNGDMCRMQSLHVCSSQGFWMTHINSISRIYIFSCFLSCVTQGTAN